ncbi:DUF3304 domain-containing protein [Providencia rettgeri]|nr:DUF3304 domain-containing protein [Providencia rettgeri]MBC8655053.1 DUF3304 domain-containing protein [Providencia vermicola]EIL1983933.1 DUF3304 domain-containing protein [Providencia rettgeri]EIU9514948.1 DUF3304 domain-containing protein [Providencia rettgeri]EJD6409321.1 DUF3304 domain-containing protein [Providencia rettgeri]EJD6662050.1 DUF3304 domain-containing protein [Providencia rettgeri]
MLSISKLILVCSIIVLTACSPDTKPNNIKTPPKPEKVNYVGANLLGYVHVKGIAVNKFSVNGYYGRVGGFTCCIMLPEKWQPGMQVRVEWEIDPSPYSKEIPRFNDPNFDNWMKKHEANYRQYSAIVEVPEYGDSCGLQVHFFACNQVKVTATCMGIEHPDHPFKALINQQENQSCPQ